MIITRIIFTIFILFLVVLSSWWVYVPLVILSFVLFRNYYEGIVLLFIADMLYGVPAYLIEESIFSVVRFGVPLTIVGIVGFYIIKVLRPRLRS